METKPTDINDLWAPQAVEHLRQQNLIKNFKMTDEGTFDLAEGFSAIEKLGRWTNAPQARITLPLDHSRYPIIIIEFYMAAFVRKEILPEQNVTLRVDGELVADWKILEASFRWRRVELDARRLSGVAEIVLDFELHNGMRPVALKLNSDNRHLAIQLREIVVSGSHEFSSASSRLHQYGRFVGQEARKSFDRRLSSGFWSRFITGEKVLDIGFRGGLGAASVVPIVEGAIGVDIDYPGYNGKVLPFANQSQDAVYSSHCLEHISNNIEVIQDWFRVIRVGGHIICVVPSLHLYERRRRPPSHWNRDHKRFYSPASLLLEFESALEPNSYRVRFLEENDEDYDYGLAPDRHPIGQYEIVLVIQRIIPPEWGIE